MYLPNREWHELGSRRRREVARRARRGRAHPDPHVAAVAHAWAAQVALREQDRPDRDLRSGLRWTGLTGLLALAGALLGDAAYLLLPGGGEWRERRLARRIMSIPGR